MGVFSPSGRNAASCPPAGFLRQRRAEKCNRDVLPWFKVQNSGQTTKPYLSIYKVPVELHLSLEELDNLKSYTG
jgi:hypothetical protein